MHFLYPLNPIQGHREHTGPFPSCHWVRDACLSADWCLHSHLWVKSLAHSVMPTRLKRSIFLLMRKHNKLSSLNEYRPVALRSLVLKVFERLIKNSICLYLQLRWPSAVCLLSVQDAISHLLYTTLTHVDSKSETAVYWLQFSFQQCDEDKDSFIVAICRHCTVKLG